MLSRSALGLLAFLTPAAAHAQSFSFLSGEWIVTAKGNIAATPKYPGADEMRMTAYPSLGFRRPGEAETFGAPDDPASFALIRSGGLRLGPSLKFVGARKSSDNAELVGLRDVDWTLEAGAFAEYWFSPNFRTRADIRYGFRGHRGVVADLGGDVVAPVGAWTFSAGPRMTLASTGYMSSYFGVTAAEAASTAPGVTAFSASGGVRSVGLAGAATYRFSPEWAVTGYARWDRLVGDAADSTITRVTGSPNQFTLGATVAYSFTIRIP
jgi:MipA family protein